MLEKSLPSNAIVKHVPFKNLSIVLVMAVLLISVGGCKSTGSSGGGSSNPYVGITPQPGNHTFTLAWTLGNTGAKIAITPEIPPTQLDQYPSSYIDITASFKGKLVFTTDDPYYQCFEAMAITAGTVLVLKVKPLPASGTLFLVAYNKCGPLLVQSSDNRSNSAMMRLPTIHYNDSDYVILYTFSGTPQISASNGHYVFPDAHYQAQLR